MSTVDWRSYWTGMLVGSALACAVPAVCTATSNCFNNSQLSSTIIKKKNNSSFANDESTEELKVF